MMLDTLEQHNTESDTVKRDARFVDQGRLITTAGITAGIDAALYGKKTTRAGTCRYYCKDF
jgi:transcriptional regulator GlxA family with amidase domain